MSFFLAEIARKPCVEVYTRLVPLFFPDTPDVVLSGMPEPPCGLSSYVSCQDTVTRVRAVALLREKPRSPDGRGGGGERGEN